MEKQQSSRSWIIWALVFSVALGVPAFFILRNKTKLFKKQGESQGEQGDNTQEQPTTAYVDLKDQAWASIENIVKQGNFDEFEWMNPEKTKCKFRVLDVSWDTDDMYVEMTKSGGIDFFEFGLAYETEGTRKYGYWSYEEKNGQKSFCINMKSQMGNGCASNLRSIINSVMKVNYPQYASEIV